MRPVLRAAWLLIVAAVLTAVAGGTIMHPPVNQVIAAAFLFEALILIAVDQWQ